MSGQATMAQTRGQWVTDFFVDADRLDLPALMSHFADDIDLRIANMPPVKGYAEVEKAFADFWSNLSGMSHERLDLIVSDDDLRSTQMAIVTYTRRADGKVVSMPVASYLRRKANANIDRLWIYIDIHPLFAE